MAMTVGTLKARLEFLDDALEVRIAEQPNWPFEYSIRDVVEVEIDDEADDPEMVVYIVEGSQLGYLPGIVRDNIDW